MSNCQGWRQIVQKIRDSQYNWIAAQLNRRLNINESINQLERHCFKSRHETHRQLQITIERIVKKQSKHRYKFNEFIRASISI